MSIRGDLNDMSLMNLLQYVGQGRHNHAVFLVNDGVEGVIYFQEGEPMHATVGSLVGNEAVYQLLGWTEGKFELTEIGTIPRQTINTSWNHLVLEGMRRSAERRRNGGQIQIEQKSLTAEEIEQDNNLENQVIRLLSKLEHLSTKLSQSRPRELLATTVQTLVGMVNLLSEFALDTLYIDVLPDIVAMVTGGNSATDILRVKDNRLLDPRLILSESGKGDAEKVDDLTQQVLQALIKIIEKYFLLITNSFRSSSMGDKWSITCKELINDLSSRIAHDEL
jgi:hypothetical protein